MAAAGQEQWPLLFTANGDEVQVFAPQPESFDGTRFSARAAVAVKRPQDNGPIFGAVWGQGVLEVDRDSRMGELKSFTVTDARMPGMSAEELTRFKEMLSTEIPKRTAPISIDWIVSALEEEQQENTAYENDPPEIIYRETPGVLVFIDGDPVYEAVQGNAPEGGDAVYNAGNTSMERIVNTPFLIVRTQGTHYLYGSGLWFSARDLNGPWKHETNVPSALSELAAKVDDTAELATASADGNTRIPDVVVSTKPAELLDLDGSPQFQPLPETGLLYATNTQDDLFMDITTQDYYLLASGRWYATRDLKKGPWRFVPSDALPAAFAKIPEGSAKDGALAHIAGTTAAAEAVRDARIPQTASVDRKSATVQVTYDGDPSFERVEGTNIEQAVNANTTVLRIGGRYHVCDNAVWFEGDTPDGPWMVSTEVPAEVNDIPPSSPIYNVRYVYIYDHTPDVVFVGYTPGYLGSYVQGGTVIYGTGYYYRPWRGYWRPRPFTWGFNMFYDPWVGWGYGLGWGYNWFYPAWGGYGYYHPYGCGWWGPYGYYPPPYYHHPHGHYYGHRGAVNRSESGVAQGTRPARARPANLYASRTGAGVRPSVVDRGSTTLQRSTTKQPGTTSTMKPLARDHFTDAQGNVYRRDQSRTERYDNGRWSKVPQPARNVEREPAKPTQKPGQPSVQPPVQAPSQPQVKPQDRTSIQRPARDPQRIQQDRQRGEQRMRDMDQSRQQRTQPAPTPRPERAQPQRSQPQPHITPSKGGGGKKR
ncbi:MAG: hypothetical protein ABI432_18940 [Flavobacteriales bacterium]